MDAGVNRVMALSPSKWAIIRGAEAFPYEYLSSIDMEKPSWRQLSGDTGRREKQHCRSRIITLTKEINVKGKTDRFADSGILEEGG